MIEVDSNTALLWNSVPAAILDNNHAVSVLTNASLLYNCF